MSRAIAATPTASSTADEAQQPTPLVNEDWIAVAIGAAIILLVILGLRPAVPRFGWDTPDALSATVLTAENFSKWIQVGLLMLVPAVAGARVMGVPAIPFLLGFSVLYAVAGIAQVLAGFTGSSAVGLEYVIYALVIGLVLGQTTTLRRRAAACGRGDWPRSRDAHCGG